MKKNFLVYLFFLFISAVSVFAGGGLQSRPMYTINAINAGGQNITEQIDYVTYYFGYEESQPNIRIVYINPALEDNITFSNPWSDPNNNNLTFYDVNMSIQTRRIMDNPPGDIYNLAGSIEYFPDQTIRFVVNQGNWVILNILLEYWDEWGTW